ncbi:MAG: tatB [Hyphomicrobiales bacterium]|nr:tatB [Hyphomicrobiales bacterium]
MFDFDAGKLIVIGIVALIVIGPKELPRVLRQVGQAVGKMRRMASDFQGQFMDAMREADLEDIRKDVAKMADSAKVDMNFDPVQTIRNEIGGAIEGTSGQTAALPTHGEPGHSMNSFDMSGVPSPIDPDNASAAGGIGPVTPEAVEAAMPTAPVAPAPPHAAARTGEA